MKEKTFPETRGIFPELPLVSYRRDKNLLDFLVHSTSGSQRPLDAGDFSLPSSPLSLFYMGPRAHTPSKSLHLSV